MLAALCLGAFMPLAAEEPWEFADPASAQAAEKKYSRYWYENYAGATSMLNGNSPDLEQTIARLKLAILKEAESSRRKYHPRERTNIEYFPYYFLARAYLMQGREDLALGCLEREKGFREIAGSSLAQAFGSLDSNIQASFAARRIKDSAGTLLAQAAKVQAWTQGQGAVRLGPAGRQKAQGIRSAADQLQALIDQAAPPADRLNAASDQLVGTMLDLASGELQTLAARLSSLGAEPWSAAFAGSPDLVSASACRAPGGAADAQGVEAALRAVEVCSDRVLRASRTAGAWACGAVESRRNALQGLNRQQTALGAAAATAPTRPAACDLNWQTASVPETATALDSMDLAALLGQLDSTIRTARAEIDRRVGGVKKEIGTKVARIPTIPRRCVTDLQLGQVSRNLDRLRLDPDKVVASGTAAAELATLDQRIDGAFDSLLAGLESGVGQVLGEREQCAGLDASNLDALEIALGAYRSSAGQNQLNAICSAAARADDDIRTCWQGNTELVREKLTDYRGLLEVAAAARQQFAELPAGDDLACIAANLNALQTQLPTSDVAGWVRRSRTGMSETQNCLQIYHEAGRGSLETMGQRLDRIEGAMGRWTGVAESGDASLIAVTDRAQAVAQRVQSLRSRVEGLRGLYGTDAASGSASTLRQAADTLGLTDSIPASWWGRMDDLRGKDERHEQAWNTLTARLAAQVLVDDGSKLAAWQELADVLDPFMTLSQAFGHFGRGDIDQAIGQLRVASAEGRLPERGRAAALSHVTLSYFLFMKGRASAASGSTEVARLLRQDALDEAQYAMQAQQGFGHRSETRV